jgi:hypothetical protein
MDTSSVCPGQHESKRAVHNAQTILPVSRFREKKVSVQLGVIVKQELRAIPPKWSLS